MRPFARLTLIVAALALVASWAVLGRAEARPGPGGPGLALTATLPATPLRGYLPLIARPVGPTATPALPPADFVNCATVGDPARAPNYPIQIVAIDKVAETVTLRNVSAAPIDLTGWTMCSVTGNQTHAIGGLLAASAQQTFGHTGGLIWNNLSSDPGALWTPEGSLASYWPN